MQVVAFSRPDVLAGDGTRPYSERDMQQPDFRRLAAALKHLSPGEVADVRRAFDFAVQAHAPQKREDGSPYVLHPIAVAEIVAGWKADRDTVIAALLHDVLEDTDVTKEQMVERFGRHASLLVEGITKFSQADLSPDLPLDRKIETLRKLFDVMRLDMRSIVIKLADRLHNVQTIDSLPTPERRRRFAIETLTVYYKIAFHLGMREMRRTFAEYCVPHAFDVGPSERTERNRLCHQAESIPLMLERELIKKEGEDRVLQVFLQPRNLFIFHQRVEERGGAALLQDAFSISIIVRSEEDCYHLLKTLHTLYRPQSAQFRDFIAAPSDAGYQSLHTFVTLPDGSVIEVRIRTPEMYEQAMHGVTTLLFQNAGILPPTFAWLKRSASLDLQTRDSSSAFWEALESDILRETISVTVDKQRLSLPKGATALDSAYALYDERAGTVKLLTVNGRPISGAEILREDDEVHLTFDASPQVAFDWLQMVSTRHARLLIVDVLKKSDKSDKLALGATLLQKELDHYNKGLLSELSRAQCQHVAEHFRRESFDQVLSMIGEGVLRARDIVFFMFPEGNQAKLAGNKKRGVYPFRLTITAAEHPGQDVLSQFHGIVRMSEATVKSVSVEPTADHGMEISVSGQTQDRLQFADFIELLERQEWISGVQTLLPARQKAFMLGAFLLSSLVVLADIILFPRYQQIIGQLSWLPSVFVQILPLIPILILNYYLLRLLRHYVVRMRTDRWFLGVALLLNIVGLVLLVLRMTLLQKATSSLLPLIAIFAAFLGYVTYRFFQTDALFAAYDQKKLHPISTTEWQGIKSRKVVGYGIRLLAVLVWGLEPIYIRYTPVNALAPSLRTFLLGIGVLLPSFVMYSCRYLVQHKKIPKFSINYNGAFLALIIGQVGHMYFKNASLMYTSGTNLLLFNNFSPLLGLIVAAFFWRKEIPYLKQPRNMLIVFLLGVLGGLGSSLLVYNESQLTLSYSVLGDIFAMISMFFDLLLVIGQIQYLKSFPKTDGMLLNIHIFFFLLLGTAPVIALSPLFHENILQALTPTTLFLGLGIGLFVGIGQFLNYEAFKRIDGYLAYMMFNLSVLITFVIEAFVIHSVEPTVLLIISGLLIIGASVTAEIVNSRCQRSGQ